MYLVGTIFWFSERAREMQEVLEKDYQVPTYGIFIIIAVATILFGLALGGVSSQSFLLMVTVLCGAM